MPNITGWLSAAAAYWSGGGAFYIGGVQANRYLGSYERREQAVSFDLSRVSKQYKNNMDDVRPLAILVKRFVSIYK